MDRIPLKVREREFELAGDIFDAIFSRNSDFDGDEAWIGY
jgi:hypothetical protein